MLLSVLPVELWDQVTLHFDRPEFASLVLLNKNNNEYWTPYLYHTLSIANENQDKTLATDNEQAMLRRNVQHIKTATIRSHKALALDALGALGAELDLATLFVRWQPYKDMKIALDPLIRLLECSSNLCHLTISEIGLEPVGSVLITIARCLPRLQSLSLFKDNEPIVRPIIVREFLETCSSELETLTLGVNCSSDSIAIKGDLTVMSLAGPVK